MKRIYSVIVFCISLLSVCSASEIGNAIDTTQSTIRKSFSVNQAITIVRKVVNPVIREKAIADLTMYANSGDTEAMHALGMLSYSGLGKEKNIETARAWFERASEKGLAKSAYNLAMMYRLGVGVAQNFGKAYQYLERAAIGGNAQAVYAKGYFLYKGFGCEQSYAEALACFRISAEKDNGFAMYMLGLCYRNGYGVNRDIAEANYWLQKAADKKIKFAIEEMGIDSPENPMFATMLRSASAKGAIRPVAFVRERHKITSSDLIHGEYAGTLATYDWSGQHVVKESSLDVSIEQHGSQIIARWHEDSLSVLAKGILTDTALVFTEATYTKRERYNRLAPMVWQFVQARLKVVRDGKSLFLAGNLQLYSPTVREPEKPMYISLKTKSKAVSQSEEDAFFQPKIYPNPFTDQLNVSFYLDGEQACNIEIYTTRGVKVYEESLGKLAKGAHRYKLLLDLTPANYIVKLVYGEKQFTSMVIKEK